MTRPIRLLLLTLAALAALPAAAWAQAGVSYSIPADNPFAGGGGAPEVYSLGLRNPWRFSFDRATGAIAIGDVGGSRREEIDFLPRGRAAGANFGWPCREGRLAGPRTCSGSFVAPIHEYGGGTGAEAVTVGFVVRDPAIPNLRGRLLYADAYDADIRHIATNGSGDASTGASLSFLPSFGQDAAGRLYALDIAEGAAFRLVAGPGTTLGRVRIAGSYSSPTHLTSPPNDASRLFVAERAGRIHVVAGGNKLSRPFLDIASQVSTQGERGLLSMAFAPDYATSGRVYVAYSDKGGDLRVEELRPSGNPNVADLSRRRTVLVIEHSQNTNHYGGQLQFGPDGMLYVSTGDGGSQGDPQGNAQNRRRLLGKILRIDPRAPTTRDTTAPLLRTRVPRRQRVRRLRGVVAYARCSEPCRASMSARLRIGRRSYKLRTTRRRVAAGKRVRLRASLTRRARRAVRRWERRPRRRRARVRVALRARDAAGNRSPVRKARVRVRRSRKR